MIENIKLAFYLFREARADGRLLELFRQQIFRGRIAIPAMVNLMQLQFDKKIFDAEYQFFELKMGELMLKKWTFAVPSRRIKAIRNLNRGLRGFAVAQDSMILGDVWCVAPKSTNDLVHHPDLEMLGISCQQGDVYGMDMLISPDSRGKNLAAPLQRYLQTTLKAEGCKRVYGYYWNDNVPAMWMHRMLRFKELPKRRVSRFFFFKRFETVN